ncbi:MAG: hypothetical protein IJ533_08140 [Prevotella sp.]|nr:hypothetical protein [Prevotella sp.]
MIANAEHVARALFSPRMIFNGEILPEAFKLRPSICESYLSVMRMSVSSWMNDIKAIPQHKNRILYGYAEMEVGEIRNIKLKKRTLRRCRILPKQHAFTRWHLHYC